jgi:hypothetical protein
MSARSPSQRYAPVNTPAVMVVSGTPKLNIGRYWRFMAPDTNSPARWWTIMVVILSVR